MYKTFITETAKSINESKQGGKIKGTQITWKAKLKKDAINGPMGPEDLSIQTWYWEGVKAVRVELADNGYIGVTIFDEDHLGMLLNDLIAM